MRFVKKLLFGILALFRTKDYRPITAITELRSKEIAFCNHHQEVKGFSANAITNLSLTQIVPAFLNYSIHSRPRTARYQYLDYHTFATLIKSALCEMLPKSVTVCEHMGIHTVSDVFIYVYAWVFFLVFSLILI